MTVEPASLVDIHCHGAVGETFGGTVAGTLAAAAHHGHPVVGSLVSGRPEEMERQVRVVAEAMTKGPDGAPGRVVGIHCEGPFLSEARRGAHDPSVLTDTDPALVERLVAAAADAGAPQAIRQWTFAPERSGEGVSPFVRALLDHGVVPAVGHTDADARTVRRTLGAIADTSGRPAIVTHLFNGMRPFHHRDGGAVAAAMTAAAAGDCVVEIVADGTHVAPEVVRMVVETLGPDRVVLVSDAMAATGLGDGGYVLGAVPVDVRDGVARVDDGGQAGPIAGSTRTLAGCLRWAMEVAGVTPADAERAATITPRRALGL